MGNCGHGKGFSKNNKTPIIMWELEFRLLSFKIPPSNDVGGLRIPRNEFTVNVGLANCKLGQEASHTVFIPLCMWKFNSLEIRKGNS